MAGTLTKTITHLKGQASTGLRRCKVTLQALSDASGNCDGDIGFTEQLKGLYLITCKTVPSGTDVPTAYSVTIRDSNNITLSTHTGRSTSTPEKAMCNASIGMFPLVSEALNIVFASMGNAKRTTVILEFVE